MPNSRNARRLLAGLFAIVILNVHAQARAQAPASPPAHPIVPGFERFPDDNPADSGRLLLGELNCAGCHPSDGIDLIKRQAPILNDVGSRVQPAYLRKYLSDPRAVEPGSTMPNLIAGLPADEQGRAVEELTQFLASTGAASMAKPQFAGALRGARLYHEIGCVACHWTRHDKDNPTPTASAMPLGDLTAKYTLSGLVGFLRDPHQVRPSGRMPNFRLNERQTRDLADFLLYGVKIEPNLNYEVFDAPNQDYPDFAKAQPTLRGQTAGLEAVGRNADNFAMRFTGFLQIEREGEYRFHIWADDLARLIIDGKTIVECRHPEGADARATLKPGAHEVVIEFVELAGEEVLTLEFNGPGVRRQPIVNAITLMKDAPAPPKSSFRRDADLVEPGRERFVKLGCASCHDLKRDGDNAAIAANPPSTPLQKLDPAKGCLAEKPGPGVPQFNLSSRQRQALTAALRSLDVGTKTPDDPKRSIVRTMTAYNCYACHDRDKRGGAATELAESFKTSIKEMGEEGRVPPSLTGTGDKLKRDWLRHVLANGADERPYMLTKMPAFALDHERLAGQFESADLKPAAEARPNLGDSLLRTKAIGRQLAGDKGLSCIGCHTFAGRKASGIQAIDMARMSGRLREDWVHRYLPDPQAYRPGTRMPTGFPSGKSMLPNVLDGDMSKQIAALWLYLSDGGSASPPSGYAGGKVIELKPTTEPIIYRNFLAGLSPRGIAVGYPENAHLAFDAERMRLAMIWQGSFIDAALHWEGRGLGFQTPMGDLVVQLPKGVPFARLNSLEAAWPDQSARDLGYKFLGYRLDEKQRPIFRYSWNSSIIEDHPVPVPSKPEARMVRTLTVEGEVQGGWMRAGAGSKIEDLGQGRYKIDNVLTVRVVNDDQAGKPIVRERDGQSELLVPLAFRDGKARIVQEFSW